MVGGPLVNSVNRADAAIGPVVVALLAVLALSLTVAPGLPAPGVAGGGSLSRTSPVEPPSSRSGPVTVAPAFSPEAGGDTWVGPVPPSNSMSVLVGLASQDPTGLEAEAAGEYTVGSGLYHHYLSPAQVAARYGPAPAALTGAEQYFGGFGLATQVLPGGSLLSVTGPVAGLGSAFGTSFQEYRSSTGRLFVSHPTPATLPSAIPWTGAVGLGNVSLPVPLAQFVPQVPGSVVASPAASCSGGSTGLSPCQVWTAYDAAGLIDSGTNGTGVSIGIVDVYDGGEPQTELASDLAKFDSTFLLPAPTVGFDYPVNTSVDLNLTETEWGLEDALDLEWSHAAAPGASIAMTFAPDTNVGLYEAVNWLVATDRVDVITLSWGEPDVGVYNAFSTPCSSACNASTDGSYEVLGPVLAAAALEGITVFSAAGDCGSADGTSGVSTNYPSSDPFVTGVGGTVLQVNSSGVWKGESAWSGNETGATSPGCDNQGGSGGGFAPFPRPWWQTGPGVPASPELRGDPDVSADAATPAEIFEGGEAGGVAGTSLATPLWAGVTAIGDQYAGRSLGFLDPQLYTILRGPNYSADFHDILSGNNGAYTAGPGWDPVSGIGTPIVGKLVPALSQAPRSTSSLKAGLAAWPTHGSAALTVNFVLIPSGGSGTYPLEGVYFGDGTAALVSNGSVSHVYPADGVFPAVGYVADSSGNVSASAPTAVVVGGSSLRVGLNVSDLTPAVGAADQFTATVAGGTAPYSYQFSFGDGTSLNGTGTNTTTHAFPVAGGYCADVIVTDSARPMDGGTSAIVAVAVGGAPAPVCANQTGPFRVTANSSPGVRDAPADYPSLFRVSGGEGTGTPTEVLSSSDPYVGACGCTIFRAPGTYSVSLSATNSSGTHASNETNVTVAPPLVGVFTTSATSGEAPLTVNFSVVVTGGYESDADRTFWAFGDGTTTTGAAVSHTYAAPGFYFATGDAEDSGQGNASEGFLIDVLPAAGASTPAVTATIEPAVNVVAGTTVNFSATSSPYLPPVLFNWSLGSGSSSLDRVTSETVYAPASGAPRARDFSLNVSWPLAHNVIAVAIADASFLAVETGGFVPRTDALTLAASPGGLGSGNVPFRWTAFASASGPGTSSLAWSFGNGNSSTGGAVSQVYGLPGDYTVNVTASNSWNDSARLPFGVVAHSTTPISIVATVSPQSGVAPLEVTLNASASGGAGPPFGYLWSESTNRTAVAGPDVVTFYQSPGRYNVTLTVTDWMGTTAQENWTVVVTAAPATGGEPGYLYLGVAAVVGAGIALAVAVSSRRARDRPPPTP